MNFKIVIQETENSLIRYNFVIYFKDHEPIGLSLVERTSPSQCYESWFESPLGKVLTFSVQLLNKIAFKRGYLWVIKKIKYICDS